MLRQIVIKFCLKLYQGVRLLGILDLPWIQRLYTRAYFVYKARIEDTLANLIHHDPKALTKGHIIDVGANIGFTATLLARGIPEGSHYQVHAFEPDPKNFRQLCSVVRDFKLESKVITHQSAVGAKPGQISLWINPDHPADHRILTDTFKGALSDTGTAVYSQIQVPLISLDEYCSYNHLDPVSFIKIDVQGFELEVLRGLDLVIRNNPDLSIVFELAPVHLRALGYSPLDVLEFFWSRGFSISELAHSGPPLTLSREELLERCNSLDPLEYFDLLAKK